jgi:hypothetical protein
MLFICGNWPTESTKLDEMIMKHKWNAKGSQNPKQQGINI